MLCVSAGLNTQCVKKAAGLHCTFVHNFGKCRQILKFFTVVFCKKFATKVMPYDTLNVSLISLKSSIFTALHALHPCGLVTIKLKLSVCLSVKPVICDKTK